MATHAHPAWGGLATHATNCRCAVCMYEENGGGQGEGLDTPVLLVGGLALIGMFWWLSSGEKTERVEERQEGKTDRTDSRQGGRTDRTTARQDGKTARKAEKEDTKETKIKLKACKKASCENYFLGVCTKRDNVAYNKCIKDVT